MLQSCYVHINGIPASEAVDISGFQYNVGVSFLSVSVAFLSISMLP